MHTHILQIHLLVLYVHHEVNSTNMSTSTTYKVTSSSEAITHRMARKTLLAKNSSIAWKALNRRNASCALFQATSLSTYLYAHKHIDKVCFYPVTI